MTYIEGMKTVLKVLREMPVKRLSYDWCVGDDVCALGAYLRAELPRERWDHLVGAHCGFSLACVEAGLPDDVWITVQSINCMLAGETWEERYTRVVRRIERIVDNDAD